MQALGYHVGQNVILHTRHANGDRTRLSALAAELVAERVAVIVAVGSEATEAAHAAAPTLPVVMAGIGDPVGSGFVTSLAHPGGTTIWSHETADKQLEILKEAVPHIQE